MLIYHTGYDPDEMQGRVLYIIDLFVTDRARGLGVGSRLMKAVAVECRKIGGIDIYFGVVMIPPFLPFVKPCL